MGLEEFADKFLRLIGLGRFLGSDENSDEERQAHLEKAEEIEKSEADDFTAHKNAGDYLASVGLHEDAQINYKNCHLIIAGRMRDAEQDIKEGYRKAGQYLESANVLEEASDCFERAGDLDGRIRMAQALGWQSELGQLHTAKAEELIDGVKDTRVTAKVAGNYFESVGDYRRAREMYRMGMMGEDVLRMTNILGETIGSQDDDGDDDPWTPK